MLSEGVLAQWWRLVAFRTAMNLLYWAMCVVQYRCTAPRPLKRPAKWVHFTLLFCLLLPWQLREQYGAISHPMTVSSGFQCSPGHAALGNATCIALTPPHGHQNGLQRRCIHLLLPPLLSDQIIAKRPWYGLFKLTLSYDINLIDVISIFIRYWPLPITMDANSAGQHCCQWASPISINRG